MFLVDLSLSLSDGPGWAAGWAVKWICGFEGRERPRRLYCLSLARSGRSGKSDCSSAVCMNGDDITSFIHKMRCSAGLLMRCFRCVSTAFNAFDVFNLCCFHKLCCFAVFTVCNAANLHHMI